MFALRAAVVALLLAHGLTGSAWAHASLNTSSPEDGSVVVEAPKALSLTFSEPVSPLVLRLIGPDGSAVVLDRFALKDRTVEIEAPKDLPRGTHVLAWRVVSEDGHPVGGSVVFSIGEASARAPSIEERLDWTATTGLWLSKVMLYVGLFFGVGGVVATRALMPGIPDARRAMAAALAFGALGAVLSAGFQGLDALAAPAARFFDPVVWSAGIGTTYGLTLGAALLAFAVAAFALAGTGPVGTGCAIAALLVAGVSLASSGHASAAQPQWLMRPSVFLHAVAIAVWIGALAPLGLALKRRRPGANVALRRFSRAIPPFVAVLVATGIVLALVQVERPSALLDTAYGRILLLKLALLTGLFALAAINRWRLTGPAESEHPSAIRALAGSIAIETLIVLAILGTVAIWRFTPPPRALSAGAEPVTAHLHAADAMARLTVTPGRAGPVAVSAAISAGDSSALDAKEVTFVFSKPEAGIEPFKRKALKGEGGTWSADGVTLPLPGVWRVRIDVLVSDFKLVRLDGDMRLAP